MPLRRAKRATASPPKTLGPDAKASLCMARNLGPKGVSSIVSRGDTPLLAAAIVAQSTVFVVAPAAKRGALTLGPLLLGHPGLCETFVAVAASLPAAINARPDQQLRRAARMHLERRHGMKL